MFLRELPEELLLKILGELNIPSQAKASEANRFFNQLCSHASLALSKEKPRVLKIGEHYFFLKSQIHLPQNNKMRFELLILDKSGNELDQVTFSSQERFEKLAMHIDQKNREGIMILLKEFGMDDYIQNQMAQETCFRIL